MNRKTLRKSKEQIARKIDRGIDNIKSGIDGLRNSARRAEAGAKNMYEKSKAEWRRDKALVKGRLGELKESGGRTAGRVKTRATKAYRGVKNAARRVGKPFR